MAWKRYTETGDSLGYPIRDNTLIRDNKREWLHQSHTREK